MLIDIVKFNQEVKEKKNETAQAFKNIRKQYTNKIDELFSNAHEEVFAETDCLTCANCCKTTSPVFKSKDIEGIAKYLKLKPGQLVEKYLHMDDEGDWVLNSSPCVFLNTDNSCSVYAVRPTACKGYPHTDVSRVHGLLSLTESNAAVCPAVFEMVKRINAIIVPDVSPFRHVTEGNKKTKKK